MRLIITVLLSVICAVGVMTLLQKKEQTATQSGEVYARIMETKTIRCGYAIWPPYTDKDPNTGKMSGITVDTVEALADYMNLKVEWVHESGWGSFAEDLNSNRIDMMCGGVWPDHGQIKASMLLEPVLYTGLYPIVRADDTRFDADLSVLNDPQYKISTIDGDSTVTLAKRQFPKASLASLVSNANDAQRALDVSTGKADVMFSDPDFFANYNKTNPGKLKMMKDKPVWMYGNRFAVKSGEFQLGYAFNTAIQEMISAGIIDNILSRYDGVEAIAPNKSFERD